MSFSPIPLCVHLAEGQKDCSRKAGARTDGMRRMKRGKPPTKPSRAFPGTADTQTVHLEGFQVVGTAHLEQWVPVSCVIHPKFFVKHHTSISAPLLCSGWNFPCILIRKDLLLQTGFFCPIYLLCKVFFCFLWKWSNPTSLFYAWAVPFRLCLHLQ